MVKAPGYRKIHKIGMRQAVVAYRILFFCAKYLTFLSKINIINLKILVNKRKEKGKVKGRVR